MIKSIKQKLSEQKLVQKVLHHFIEARTAKAAETKKWKTQEDFYQGRQWKSKKAYQGQIQPVTNICFSIVESIIPQLTDNRPQIVCLPTEKDDEEKAEILTKIIEHIWDKRDMDYKLTLNERTRIKHGMSIYKVFWNPELVRGLGDVDIINVPLDQFFISPRAKSVQDSEYVIYASQKSVEYIEKRYKKKVQPDKKYDEIAVFDQEDEDSRSSNKVLLIEYWTKENGKLRLVTIAGDTLLRDEEAFYEHGKYPFVAVPTFPIEKSFWAMGILAQIMSPQMMVNLLDQQILDNARLGANGRVFVGATSGVNEKALTNMPYQVVPVTDVSQIRVEEGKGIPSFIQSHLVTKKKDAELVSGIHDVTQGKAPGGITAATAIMALQESANQRVRLLGRTLEAGLKEMGELIIELVREFYTEERTIRILGDNYKTTFITFKSDDLKRSKDYPHFEDGQEKKETIEIDPEFDIRVEIGSSMQYSKAFLYEQAKELFGMQVIDDQALLEIIRFPKTEEVLERKRQAQQQAPMPNGQPQQGIPDFQTFVQNAPPELQQKIQNMMQQGMSEDEIMKMLLQPQ